MTESRNLREDALAIFSAGIAAVEPRKLVRDRLESRSADLPDRVWVVAIGKGAATMARGAEDVLGARLAGGIVIAPPGVALEAPASLEVFEGGHPIPNPEGMRGAVTIRELASGLTADDFLLCLISGGGSALMTLPPDDVGLEEMQGATDRLLKAGATIQELNCFRKHLDQLKGGRLAELAAPARVQVLILSDVVGDPVDVIASGPVSPDPTTYADAIAALARHGLAVSMPESVLERLRAGMEGRLPESPKPGDPCFERVEVAVIGNNRIATEAALAEARVRGYSTRLLGTEKVGEAKAVGAELAGLGRAVGESGEVPACLLAAGETTVTVTGKGRGGRNQELVLGAALNLSGSQGILVASAGTDGIDGPTDAAGAMADGQTVSRSAEAGLDARDCLAENDAYTFFKALDDLIVTGPTGTNVMDLMLVLVSD